MDWQCVQALSLNVSSAVVVVIEVRVKVIAVGEQKTVMPVTVARIERRWFTAIKGNAPDARPAGPARTRGELADVEDVEGQQRPGLHGEDASDP
ncbi:hypothetical protein Acy02nite_90160 [Actinoplanes cyaneus]|uniref:Uncharacterized protein n=1 Tax=Actinoplanes cyaneus TaxID=52696 RepID=A0A919M644_9ACTN|nr:hypothetical protein Acy02nite_90160 [Actinoplanes cyaneus]